jgi:hypothetical protein
MINIVKKILISCIRLIQSLTQFACTSKVYSNEMELIAAWSKINPKLVFAPNISNQNKRFFQCVTQRYKNNICNRNRGTIGCCLTLSNLSLKTSFKGTRFLQFQSYLSQFFTKNFFIYYFLKVKLKFL